MKARILSLLILIFGVVAIFNLSRSIHSLLKKGDLFVEKGEERIKLKQKNEELIKELERVQSPEFIEKEAREKLSMGKAGEVVVIMPKTPKIQDSKTPKEEELPNWEKWYKLFFY